MSQLTLDNLETLKNKMIKDHEAALKLINLSIQQVKDEMGMGGDGGTVKSSSTRASTLQVKDNYDLRDSVMRNEFKSLIGSLKSTDKIYVTSSSVTPYGVVSLNITIDTVNNGMATTQVTYTLNAFEGLEVIGNMVTDIGLSSAQFCGTLLNQGSDGTKQIAIIGIPGLPYFAINVLGKTANSKGRPITYFFTRADINGLAYNNRAVVTAALFGQ